MKNLFYTLPFFAASFLISCGAEESSTESTDENATTEETTDEVGKDSPAVSSSTYSIDPSTVEVKWTAFKLAEKVGVNGKFTEFALSGHTDNAVSITEMMTGTAITIAVASTNTDDEARDGKIVASFFGTMLNTENIVATITSMNGEEEGTAMVEITMNDTPFTQEMNWLYRSDLGAFIIKGSINVPDWNAQSALDALNVVCEEKHKGTGDEAITWPDVEVSANVKVIVNSPSEL